MVIFFSRSHITLLEIKIEIWNTSSFLGLCSRTRSRLNSGTHPRFRALLEMEIKIEIKLRNTSSFLGLYLRSRLRSNSGTHPRFRALLEIEIDIAPVHGQGTLCTSPTTQKNYMKRGHQTNKQTNRQTNTHHNY